MKLCLAICTLVLCSSAAHCSFPMDPQEEAFTARLRRMLDENFRIPYYEPARITYVDDGLTED